MRERSRSRSASRPLKIAKGSKSTETAKLEFINEELPEITSSNKKSPGKRVRKVVIKSYVLREEQTGS